MLVSYIHVSWSFCNKNTLSLHNQFKITHSILQGQLYKFDGESTISLQICKSFKIEKKDAHFETNKKTKGYTILAYTNKCTICKSLL